LTKVLKTYSGENTVSSINGPDKVGYAELGVVAYGYNYRF
jgi:hypothetical protein